MYLFYVKLVSNLSLQNFMLHYSIFYDLYSNLFEALLLISFTHKSISFYNIQLLLSLLLFCTGN